METLVLTFVGIEDYTVPTVHKKYRFAISNYEKFDDELFAKKPGIPDSDPDPSRTKVEIYDGNNNRIKAFGKFTCAKDLATNIFFPIRLGQQVPGIVYIKMIDSKTNTIYQSNSIVFMAYTVLDSIKICKESDLLGNLNVEGNVGIGTTEPNAKLHVQGNISINDNDIRLRGGKDRNHGIGWYGPGKPFAGMGPDGPVVFGNMGGALGINHEGVQKIALYWNSDGNVCIGTTSRSSLEVKGDIKVAGDIFLTNGADCAEDFEIIGAETVQPGTVMIIDRDGALQPSQQAYDKRVAGVISGAGDFHPGITLDRHKDQSNRLPLALNGKVYCKVDAEYNPVEVGDLLTTSNTNGHAMKAEDRDKAFGAVIGKALNELKDGKGLIPILVALQ